MKIIAATLLSGALVLGPFAAAKAAFSVQNIAPTSPIIKAYNGCGPMGHRGPRGWCRPGGQWGGYRWARPCPWGFHLGPYGRRCWPNRW